MARRRSSPLPPEQDTLSGPDDEIRHSDDEQLLEDEDPQSTIHQPRGGLVGLLSRLWPDQLGSQHIPLRERTLKRQRLSDRRVRRRGVHDEASLMFSADSVERGRQSDETASDFSEEFVEKLERERPARRRSRFGKTLLHAFFCVVVIAFAILLMTKSAFWSKPNMQDRAPIAKPATILSNGTSNFGPTTILISLDGFRADFLDRGITPSISSFVSSGVSPKFMLPSFPSVTFPNHWTLVTGLYPESHGVVGNSFWDEALGEQFYYTDPLRSMFPKWWASTGAQSLWETAETRGIRTAIHMWPGSEAGLQPEPMYLDAYNGKEKLSRKVERVLTWLDLPSPFGEDGSVDTEMHDPRPQFIAMYVPDVDRDGHSFGPNSTEIKSTIADVDDMVGLLLSGLEARNLSEIVNVVIVSDHGMATTSRDRLVQLEDLVDPAIIERYDGWPLYGLRMKPDVDIPKLHSALSAQLAASGENPGWSVFTLDTMPERWHFSRNPRIAPLFLIPDAGWSIVTKEEMDLSNPATVNAVYHPKGIHGYDNEHPLMRAIFAARGPAFPHPPGSRIEPFVNVEVYGIVCQSLGMEPLAYNGSLQLPLSVQGLHGDGGHGDKVDEPVDLPTGDGQPLNASLPTGGSGDSPPASGKESEPDGEGDAESGENGGGPLHDLKGKLQEAWDEIKDTVSHLTGWVSGLFGGKKTGSN